MFSVVLTICTFLLTLFLFLVVVIVRDEAPMTTASNSPTSPPPGGKDEIHHPGEKLFNANCKACHRIHQKLVGPALAGVLERRDSLWVIKMIRNSAQLIASGDPVAVKLFEEYNRTQMTSFTTFSDQELRDLLTYLKLESERKPEPVSVPEVAV